MRGPALPLSDLIPIWASVYFSAKNPQKCKIGIHHQAAFVPEALLGEA